jgi:thioredoxin-related protein
MNLFASKLRWACTLLILLVPALTYGATDDDELFGFNDYPLEEPLTYPDWFQDPFLDLPAELQDVKEADKSGLILYFGQRRCAYCWKLINVNFALEDIVAYTRRHFDVVPIDIWGISEVTDLDGEILTERELALREETNFTPSLLFYDESGTPALRLRGYYPPYQLRAALEYVADDHYRRESFRDYLARGDNRMVFEPGDLNEADFFSPPPYDLDRTKVPAKRPLVVFFEQGNCHACDVLHGQTLDDPAIMSSLTKLDSVQLDMWSNTPVVTPSGEHTTARDWAHELGLFYAPSLLFFDERGEEIIRVASVVGFYRLSSVLDYINTGAYEDGTGFQTWRVRRAL